MFLASKLIQGFWENHLNFFKYTSKNRNCGPLSKAHSGVYTNIYIPVCMLYQYTYCTYLHAVSNIFIHVL